jgi:hypothetical protein
MSKVFIVQDLGRLNFIPAEQFGELISCIDGRVSHVGMQKAFSRLQKSLSRIRAEDWLVPTGHPALIAFAGHLMARQTGVLRVLSWDNQTGTYIPSQISIMDTKPGS